MPIEIVTFAPRSGKSQTQVTITLTGMTDDYNTDNTKVYIGEERLYDVSSVDPQGGTIRVLIDDMARTGKFSVQGGDDLDYTTATEDFTVTGSDEATPTITIITAQGGGWGTGEFKQGQRLTATGRNLAKVNKVWIGNSICMVSGEPTATSLNFTVPPAMKEGQYFVKIGWGLRGQTARFNRQITIIKKTT
jgi:CubicO group peptidase (beta-lactamase class C family)